MTSPALSPRYEEFMDASAKLNSLDHYPSLMERSKRVGYAVTKVVFRGYQASDQLQVQLAFTDCI